MSETVRKAASEDRFEIVVDGSAVGHVAFVDHRPGDGEPTQRVLFHTEVDEAYGGRGLAGKLVGGALDATRAEGLRVVAVCPYVKKYVSSRPEYDDLVVAVTPAALEAIPRS